VSLPYEPFAARPWKVIDKPTEPMKTYKVNSIAEAANGNKWRRLPDSSFDFLWVPEGNGDARLTDDLVEALGLKLTEPKPESVFRGEVERFGLMNEAFVRAPFELVGKEVTVVVGNVVWSVLMEQSTDLQVGPGHSVTCHKGRRVIVVEESQ